jgi:LmbE family N-acetylglucosaminyl deacetylase
MGGRVPISKPVGGYRRAKEALRLFLQKGLEEVWSAAFRRVGKGVRGGLRILETSQIGGKGDVLVIAPHPDDEVAGCAGAILAHRRAGDRVHVLCVTDGRRSTAYGLEPEVMAEEREKEARSAADLLDAELHFLGLPEGDWKIRSFSQSLTELVSKTRPTYIYAPSALDFHPEHRKVAKGLSDTLPTLSHQPEIRVYEIQVPLTPRPANLFLAGVSRERVEAAIRCHRTQIGSVLCSLRRRRYAASMAGLEGYAEAFWTLDPSSYTRIHQTAPPAAAFRSLRYWALTDPLAYWKGRGLRALLSDGGNPQA